MASSRLQEARDYVFADQVLALRLRAGLSQHELSVMLGVSTQSIHAWEAGLSYPGTERLKQIIAFYLDRGVLEAGREAEEAKALWSTVRERAPRRTLPFDSAWFALLGSDGTTREERVARFAHRQAPTELPGEAPVAPLGISIKVRSTLTSHAFYSSFGSAFRLVPVRAYGDPAFAKAFAGICPGVDCRPRNYCGIIYNIISRGGQRARLEVSEGHPDVPHAVHQTDMETAKVSIRLEVDSLADVIRSRAYQEAAGRAVTDRGGFVKSYNWGTIEAPIRDPDGVVIVFVVHWDQRDPRKEEEIKQAIAQVKPEGAIRWIDERTVTEFPEPD
jgi:transcriptional regulator with XRE-family HTH domain